MPITRDTVARKLAAYLHHEISLHALVDWAQLAMMEEELERVSHDAIRDVVARLGLADVQRRQSELDDVEVKAARGSTPRRLYEPLSAFANSTGGGVLLFGLDESKDFSIVGVGDVQRLQEEITHLASAEMEPALRPHFLVDEIDGETIVAVEVEEISAAQKPCFYKQAGLPKGTYLRVGNTNRQVTEYEVFGYLSSRGQPTYDEEFIPHAAIDALDGRLLDAYLGRLQQICPGAGFLDGTREAVLTRLHNEPGRDCVAESVRTCPTQ